MAFSPAVKVVSQANENYFLHSSSSDFVIGVHIRHRDFKDWKKGSFFFETTYYAEIMQKILCLFPQKKLKFLLFSDNENLNTAAFESFDY